MEIHHCGEQGIGAKNLDDDPRKIDGAIHAAERVMEELPDELKVSVEALHHFVPGLYIRELRMPAGSFLTGKYHRHKDILIIAKGSATFITKDGMRTLEAPCITTVEAETKPLIRCNTDVVFVSAHANPDDCRDIEEIEKRHVITPEELENKRKMEEIA